MVDRGKKVKITNYKELEAWKEAHKLVVMIYELVKSFPKDETWGLSSQMKRAALSVSSNIAEGFGRFGSKEKLQFFNIARGSLIELDNQLSVALDVHYISNDTTTQFSLQVELVHKLINGLRKYARNK